MKPARLVVYVCFLKDATADVIPKMVHELMRLRVCESTDGHLVRLPELPGSLLIVPQATLGGRSKAGRLQYHGNACRAEAEALFAAFAEQCGVALQEKSAPDSGSVVLHGTYGSRQMLELESDGPGTSLLEF
uniref:D-aminoacyl-tRNA deacylase n=1 Tax=Eptatretus burgeri TaxID=7764 RepID=A0A8C4Q1W2_EPTBU